MTGSSPEDVAEGADAREHRRAFVGRALELARLEGMIANARTGISDALLVTGDPGIGKTRLIEQSLAGEGDVLILRLTGVEAEVELAYGALHRLLRPFTDVFDRLPEPQRLALEVVFGLELGPAPDRFLVGLAALTVLTDLARGSPLVCFVDDAQWIDRSSLAALGFVSRRVLAEGIVLLFAAREAEGLAGSLERLPELRLSRLSNEDSKRLLETHFRGINRLVAGQIAQASIGNPLALTEFPRHLTEEQLAGRTRLPDPLPSPLQVDALISSRLVALSGPARTALLVAACEPAQDRNMVWNAVERLGGDALYDVDAVAEELADLVELREEARFRHPLVRSSAVADVPPSRLREVHRALADVIGDGSDPDRRAWHLAMAADGSDDAAADELVQSAERARGRGGYPAEATFLARASELTSDAKRRVGRRIAAAEAALLAGDVSLATALSPALTLSVDDPLLTARGSRLTGAIALMRGQGVGTPGMFATAARMFEPYDPRRAREAWIGALHSTLLQLAQRTVPAVVDVAREARRAPEPRDRPGDDLDDLLFHGMTTLVVDGHAAALPILRKIPDGSIRPGGSTVGLGVQSLMSLQVVQELWDIAAGRRLLSRLERRYTELGAIEDLRVSLLCRRRLEALAGDLDAADRYFRRATELNDAVGGSGLWTNDNLETRAARGDDSLLEVTRDLTPDDAGVNLRQGAVARLHIGRTRYREALAMAEAATGKAALPFSTHALPDRVEAAARLGDLEHARFALGLLAPRLEAAATHWSLGVLARCRALIDEEGDPEPSYTSALEHLSGADATLDLARTHLVYGEWLRRARRRSDSAEQLAIAHRLFRRLGADGFADRSRLELDAADTRPRQRRPETLDTLTTRERQVAEAAARGQTNKEIAAAMFLSEVTVAYHLQKTYRKFGISSRRQLAAALAREASDDGE
jgi:DNA-binding CsgD family transcriptional regulator